MKIIPKTEETQALGLLSKHQYWFIFIFCVLFTIFGLMQTDLVPLSFIKILFFSCNIAAPDPIRINIVILAETVAKNTLSQLLPVVTRFY